MIDDDMAEAIVLALYNDYRVRSGMFPVDYIGANQTPALNRIRSDVELIRETIEKYKNEKT